MFSAPGSLINIGTVNVANGASEELKLTNGITHLVGVKGFKTFVDRTKLPDSAKNFTGISVSSSNSPIGVEYVGIEEFAGRPDPYQATGYSSGLPYEGTYYVLTILYDGNRKPVGYKESVIDVPDGNQSPAPQNPTSQKPADPFQYGGDIDPNADRLAESQFSDVSNDYWAAAAIQALSDRNVITGYPDGKFRPEKVVTRAEFAKIMVLAAGLKPEKTASTSFSDIKPSEWHTPFIEAAKDYLSGYSLPSGKLTFTPEAPALREDIAVAIVKLKGYNKSRLADRSVIKAMFKDYEGISEYAKDYVALAVETKLVSGFPDDTFRAQKPITRAQAAAMLYRAYQFGDDNKNEQAVKIEVPDAPFAQATFTDVTYEVKTR